MSSLSLFKSLWILVNSFFRFKLMDYTSANPNNGRLLYVAISDTDYSKWVVKYRQEASKEEEDDDSDDLWRRA
jgi:hypothetical protein